MFNILIIFAFILLFFIFGFYGSYLSPWLKAKKACEVLTFKEYFKIKTHLKSDEANLIVNDYTLLVNNGISDAFIDDIINIQQYGGDIELVVSRLVGARKKIYRDN